MSPAMYVPQPRGGERLMHWCEVCGQDAAYGYGVRLLKGQLGRWYCAEHRPIENNEPAPESPRPEKQGRLL